MFIYPTTYPCFRSALLLSGFSSLSSSFFFFFFFFFFFCLHFYYQVSHSRQPLPLPPPPPSSSSSSSSFCTAAIRSLLLLLLLLLVVYLLNTRTQQYLNEIQLFHGNSSNEKEKRTKMTVSIYTKGMSRHATANHHRHQFHLQSCRYGTYSSTCTPLPQSPASIKMSTPVWNQCQSYVILRPSDTDILRIISSFHCVGADFNPSVSVSGTRRVINIVNFTRWSERNTTAAVL